MRIRRSEEQWTELAKNFKISGISLTAWCREKGISKSSFYPYLKKISAKDLPVEQIWGEILFPRNIENSPIPLKIGSMPIDIKIGFYKETLLDVLSMIMKLC